ncbi:DUF885 domain-containing protein [Kutzneria albida]|uniref:DUF885 domain-containing protein n=1 Tax=Kutzneria albida DSM 43870 TaxID=1449976 RepID=W5W809_9PSEU|nr:DUF885 domain-containing protein [Kutzneria albida]AHH97072.1 hypothetical protein KALB_3708 [Kutzneria albida DSM 43870]
MTEHTPDFVADFMAWYLDANPMHAAMLGRTEQEHTFGDLSESGWLDRERQSAGWLDRLASVRPADQDAAIDRDLIVSHLRGQRARAQWPTWRRDPAVYAGSPIQSLFGTFLHRQQPEPELVASALSRLAELPGVFAACRANLDPELSCELLVRRALSSLRTARQFLTVTLPGEVADESLRAKLAEAGESAAEEAESLATYLESFAERATGDWRMGEQLYSTLLTECEMLGYGAGELHERGLAAYEELAAEARALAGDDWQQAIRALQEDHPATLAELLAECTSETERARQFLLERDLVSFADGELCRVVPAPVFLRPLFAVPFYMAPRQLTASRTGHYFVPFTPEDADQEQLTHRLRGNFRAQVTSAAVHEAYPGHHWHLSWLAGNPRAVRKALTTSYFTEGWALYAEKMMREQGYFTDPGRELAHLDMRIFRAARIVVDTALHCGDMTVAQAEQYMGSRSSLNEGMAKAEVNRYCAWPTQAPSYLTGALEIDRIRADYLEAGLGDLKSFHDRIAGSGALPLGLARRAALGTAAA